jgi:hypothetical protein
MKCDALNGNSFAIQYIEKPTAAMKLQAVKTDPYSIVHIGNPSEKLQLLAVNQNGTIISYIKHPTEKVKIAAIKNNTKAYLNVKDYYIIMQTKEYWDDYFYHLLLKNHFNLNKKQHKQILEQYNLLQLFK